MYVCICPRTPPVPIEVIARKATNISMLMENADAMFPRTLVSIIAIKIGRRPILEHIMFLFFLKSTIINL